MQNHQEKREGQSNLRKPETQTETGIRRKRDLIYLSLAAEVNDAMEFSVKNSIGI